MEQTTNRLIEKTRLIDNENNGELQPYCTLVTKGKHSIKIDILGTPGLADLLEVVDWAE